MVGTYREAMSEMCAYAVRDYTVIYTQPRRWYAAARLYELWCKVTWRPLWALEKARRKWLPPADEWWIPYTNRQDLRLCDLHNRGRVEVGEEGSEVRWRTKQAPRFACEHASVVGWFFDPPTCGQCGGKPMLYAPGSAVSASPVWP